MPYRIECFIQIQEKHACKYIFVVLICYKVNDSNKLKDSGMIVSKTKLLINQNVVRVHMTFKFYGNYFFKNFTADAKQAYWVIIIRKVWIFPRLRDRYTYGIFPG